MNKTGESPCSWGLTCLLLPVPCTFPDDLSCQIILATCVPADRLVGESQEGLDKFSLQGHMAEGEAFLRLECVCVSGGPWSPP